MRVDRGMSCRAITGEEDMNKADLGARLAAEFSLTRATAGRMFGAVFAAIGGSLANEEPVSIAGFGTFGIRARPARQGLTIPPRDDPDRRLAHARVQGRQARRCSGVESVLLAVSCPDNRNSRPERPAPARLLSWEPR